MSQINSLRAYDDCRLVFEAALADPKGSRVRIGTQEAAMNMRTRMHYFRNLDRKANANIYPQDHPQYGTSVYDPYVVRNPIRDEDGEWWLYVEPRAAADLLIEGLSEVDGLIDANVTDAEAHEVHMIEDQSK